MLDKVTALPAARVTKSMSVRTVLAVFLVFAGTGTVADAQARARAYVDISISGTALVGRVPFNDAYYDPTSSGLVLLALGHQPDVNRPLLAALQVGLFLGVVGGSDGWCRPTPLGGCLQSFPLGAVVALTVGGRPLNSRRRFAELTAGPAVVAANDGGASVGLLAVARIGLPPGFYLSPGVAFHGLVTPIHGTVMFVAGVGVSLRTW
jgi:hypothetical protein